MASYDGFDLGYACRVEMLPAPSELQVNAFFGVSGVQTLWGGNRGRIFTVNAVAAGANAAAVDAKRDTLLSYADGIGRVLVDDVGASWSYVIFTGQFQFTGPYGVAGGLVVRPYTAVFRGNV